jgi:hypothetical protein
MLWKVCHAISRNKDAVILKCGPALPSLNTFNSLLQTLQGYPTPLSKTLIPFLFELLIQSEALKDAHPAQIHAIYSTRHLSTVPQGPAFVKGLKLANEELVTACHRLYEGGCDRNAIPSSEEEGLSSYAHFIGQQWEAVSEENLVGYNRTLQIYDADFHI